MRFLCIVFLVFVVAGCRKGQSGNEKEEVEQIVRVPLLEDVPICAGARSIHSRSWEVMEVRVLGSGEEYLRDGIWFQGEGADLAEFLKKRSDDERRRVLRIWAGPEVRFKVVNKVIQNAASAGIRTLLFAVRESPKATRYHDLVLNFPICGIHWGDAYFSPRKFYLDEEERFFHIKDSGKMEKIDEADLVELLGILRSVSEMTETGVPHFRLFAEPGVGYQGFVNYWKVFVEHEMRGGIDYWDPRWEGDVQRIPTGPSPYSKPTAPAKVKSLGIGG